MKPIELKLASLPDKVYDNGRKTFYSREIFDEAYKSYIINNIPAYRFVCAPRKRFSDIKTLAIEHDLIIGILIDINVDKGYGKVDFDHGFYMNRDYIDAIIKNPKDYRLGMNYISKISYVECYTIITEPMNIVCFEIYPANECGKCLPYRVPKSLLENAVDPNI